MAGKRKPCRFRENEVARGVRAVLKGGGTVKRVIIGDVIIECGGSDAKPPHNSTDVNEWDLDLNGKNTPPVRKRLRQQKP
jgi:hypothetical protein